MIDNPATEAARLLGSIKTAKKAAASRENGKRGGRPRKEPSPVTITINRPAKATEPAPPLPLNELETA